MKNNKYSLTKAQRAFFLGALFSTSPLKALKGNVIDMSLFDTDFFDVQAMEKAFNLLLKKNDSLRIVLLRKGLLFFQEIIEYQPVQIEKIMVKNKKEFDTIVFQIRSDISITSKPLYKVKMIECEDGTGGICICFHHLIIDGYSKGLVYQQLNESYQLFKNNQIPEENNSYSIKQYFKIEKKYLSSEKYKRDRKFWQFQYNHQPRYSFPAGKVPTRDENAVIKASFSAEEYSCLSYLCNHFSCSFTPMIMGLSALTVLSLTGEHNFAFFNIVHGRMNFQMKKTIGNMYNNYPVFYDIPEGLTIEEYIKYSVRVYMEHLQHSKFPVADMTLMTAKETHIKRFGYGHQWCMFSTTDMMNRENQRSLEYITTGYQMIFSIFYIALNNYSEEKRLDADVYYQKKCFNSKQVKKIINCFKEILTISSTHFDQRIEFLMKNNY